MSRLGRVPWIAGGLAAVLGGALLVLAVWIEPGAERPRAEPRPRIVEATDVIAPGALRADEATGAAKGLASQGVALEKGAWVQVADESGRLAQQYSASRIDPERDRWMRMAEPRAMMFPKGGRVITMRAEKGRLRVPERAIESGRLDGSVVIRLYKPDGSRAADTAKDAPALVVEADEALFDSRLGEVRCDRRVKVVTDQLRFEGEGLTMLLTPDGRNIERLTVERPLSPIEIVRRVQPEPPAPVEFFGPPAPAASGPSWNPPPAAAAAPPNPVRFYRLTLERDVKVLRQGPKDRARMEGDRLDAIFSLEGDAVGRNLADAGAHGVAPCAVALEGGIPLALLAGAVAAPADELERIEIRYTGRLTMVVTEDPADRLSSKDDVRVDISGAPARMEDEASGARVDCGSLRYTTGDEAVAISAERGKRFVLASPRLDLEATRFELNRRTGSGAIEGEGRMRLGGADGAAVQVMAAMPEAAVKSGAGQGEVHGAAVPPSARTVRMQWSKGVTLAFEPGAQAARLRKADFRGAVMADADEVRLGAERLLVECAAQGSRDSVTHLLAEGAARAVRQPEGSSLAGERIDLALEPQADGGSRPLRLLADGRVEAADKGQRLWTDAMECTFKPVEAGASSERVDVAEVRSRGAVQALVSQDARIWAADMDADPTGKRVTLKGPDLLLVRGNAVADGMQRIDMDEAAGVGSAPGPGRCRYFSRSLVDAAPQPLPRPVIPAGESMLATWGDGLRYRRVNERSSEVELAGGVKAKASRSARELDELDCRSATLTLATDGTAAPARSGVAAEASNLTRVHAAGEVRLESRAWSKDDHSDEPRLFRLQAEDLTHDLVTGESEVPTAGTLLVFDRDDEGARAAPPSLFDGRGTTRFKWANRLDMRRQALEGRYRIDLDGTVEMLHAGLRPQDTLTLTADRLQATVDRVQEQAPARARGEAAPADLGAPVQLVRVEGLGRVFVRTPDVDVECDTFDYDLKTRIAQMGARPGRMITVLQKGPKGQPVPMRAESAQWDMESGRIRILGASGTGMR